MASDIAKLILHIAQIMIDELKLEDVTPETFDADIDLVDEVGIDSMDLATVALVLRDEYAVRIDEDDFQADHHSADCRVYRPENR